MHLAGSQNQRVAFMAENLRYEKKIKKREREIEKHTWNENEREKNNWNWL